MFLDFSSKVWSVATAEPRAGVIARALRRVVAAMAMGAVVLLGAGGAAWADVAKADVETRLEKGYGRLILTFKNRDLIPQFTVRQNNGVAVVDFVDQIELDFEQAMIKLAPFVSVARKDPEGRALRLALVRQVKVNTMEAGEKLFIDFLPPTWTGQPPTLPQDVIEALARKAEAAIRAAREAEMAKTGSRVTPKLDFKIGRLPTFTRFSFAWNVAFDTRMTREGERVTVAFNRVAKVDFSAVDVEPVPGLVDVFADPTDEQLRIVFTVAPDADVRAFRDGNSYVLDLVRNTPPANAGEATVRAILADPTPGRDRISAPGRTEAAPAPQAAPAPAQAAVPVAAPAPAAPAPVASAPVPVAPAPVPAVPAATTVPAPAAMVPPLPPVAAAPAPAPAPIPVAGAPSGEARASERDLPSDEATAPPPPASSDPAPTRAAGLDGDAPAGELPATLAPRRVVSDQPVTRVEAKRIGDVVRMTFPFAQKVAAAAFMRNEALWVVFDTASEVDVATIAPNLGPLTKGVSTIRGKTWTALRIELTDPLLTTLSPDGNNWVLSVGEMVLEPTKPLKLRRFVRGDGNSMLKIDLPGGGAVHEFVDPVIGDRLVVVTAHAPSRGLVKPQTFVDLETLASAHGIALVPRGDDLLVALENGEVAIARERGLSLTNGAVEERGVPVPRLQTTLHRVPIDPSVFERVDAQGYERRTRELLAAVVEGRDLPRRQARIDLAEFFIGQRFAPEAMAQLRILAEEEPAIAHDPGFIVLYGAAQALAGRATQAREALGRSEVAENSDASLWRTIAANEASKWDEARENALKATHVLGAYPKSVQALFNISAAEAATELNDVGLAQARMAEIEPEMLEPDLAGRFELVQARLADAAGRPEDAMARFDRAKATGHRRTQAEAEYRIVRNLVRDGKIDREEAIERMRSLTFGWRGDEIELRTLRFLAGLLADSGRYREAFQAMRSALQVAPDAQTTRLLQDEMGRRFLAIYLDDADKALSPIDALTLYYDFRELVPVGRRGDEVVRKLADRLVGVDLLPQAAELLTHQVDNRLKGAARAQIAADLAVVHLLDRKPDRALAVLNKTRQSQLPLALERQRRLVEARALSDAGRTEVSLELLSSMSGSDVLRLKADVLWKAKRWREAGERLEAMLGARWQDGTPLDDQERQDVLRVAIGYALANDQLSLDRLRGKYGAKMAASPNARTFDVVTQPIQAQGKEFRDVARDLAALDTMRQFLQEYRAQYLDPKARTVVPEEAVKPGEGAAKAAPPAPQAKAGDAAKVAAADPAAAKGGAR